MFFSSELRLLSCKGLGKLSWLEVKELLFVDGDVGSPEGSSTQAQKSLIRSPGRLKPAEAQLDICNDRDERFGSQPKCLPIPAAIPGLVACSCVISTGTCWSEDDAASERTE
jgi:hypothetical protein